MSTIRAPFTASPSPTTRPLTIASLRSGEYKMIPSTASNGAGDSSTRRAGCARAAATGPGGGGVPRAAGGATAGGRAEARASDGRDEAIAGGAAAGAGVTCTAGRAGGPGTVGGPGGDVAVPRTGAGDVATGAAAVSLLATCGVVASHQALC